MRVRDVLAHKHVASDDPPPVSLRFTIPVSDGFHLEVSLLLWSISPFVVVLLCVFFFSVLPGNPFDIDDPWLRIEDKEKQHLWVRGVCVCVCVWVGGGLSCSGWVTVRCTEVVEGTHACAPCHGSTNLPIVRSTHDTKSAQAVDPCLFFNSIFVFFLVSRFSFFVAVLVLSALFLHRFCVCVCVCLCLCAGACVCVCVCLYFV